VFEEGGKVDGRVVSATLDELSAGDVVITTIASSVNYKDALAATGAARSSAAFR
jgi:NADPH:quinone reductase-like Zn-dependent oxidoreductase